MDSSICPYLNKRGITYKQYKIDIIKEFFRKSIHICSSLVPLFLKLAYIPAVSLLVLALVIYTASELARLHGKNIPLISQVTAIAARKRDENKFVLGPVTLVLGILTASLVWNHTAASIGIYALAFGDGLASLAGKLFGRVRIPYTQGKTVAGSLTCFTAIFISCSLTCNDCKTALIIACTGMFIELLPLKDFDNILIPVLLGGLAQNILSAI